MEKEGGEGLNEGRGAICYMKLRGIDVPGQ